MADDCRLIGSYMASWVCKTPVVPETARRFVTVPSACIRCVQISTADQDPHSRVPGREGGEGSSNDPGGSPRQDRRLGRHPRLANTQLVRDIDPRLVTVQRKKIGRNDPCPCGSGKKIQKMLRPQLTATAVHAGGLGFVQSGGRYHIVVEPEHVRRVVGLLNGRQALVALRPVNRRGVGRLLRREVVH
jgi:hypothetical protein